MLSALLTALLAAPAIHGQVHIQSQGQDKADRSGVVVFVADQALPPGHRPEASMKQSGRAFDPLVLAVPVGTTVRFPNLDTLEHNVFSRSPHAAFDLGRYGRGGSKTYTFDQAGVVDVYCNVHSNMVGHVVVVPGPWAVTGADGSFAIAGVSPGPHQLVAWDRLGAPAIQRQTVDVSASGEGSIDLKFVETSDAEAPHPNKFGGAYHEKKY